MILLLHLMYVLAYDIMRLSSALFCILLRCKTLVLTFHHFFFFLSLLLYDLVFSGNYATRQIYQVLRMDLRNF